MLRRLLVRLRLNYLSSKFELHLFRGLGERNGPRPAIGKMYVMLQKNIDGACMDGSAVILSTPQNIAMIGRTGLNRCSVPKI